MFKPQTQEIMKRLSTISLVVLGILFLASCKREDSMNIDQDRIYSNYEFTFDSDRNESTMTAMFRIDHSSGTKIELTYPSRVDYNGEGLAWRNGLGHYELKRTGSNHSGAFTYKDIDGKAFVNSPSSLTFVELPFGITNISQSGNFFLPWNGGAIQSGESITVIISRGAQSTSRTWTINTVGASHIILDQNKLMGLTPGNAEVQIQREFSNVLQESNLSGGRITSTYKSVKAFINIVN